MQDMHSLVTSMCVALSKLLVDDSKNVLPLLPVREGPLVVVGEGDCNRLLGVIKGRSGLGVVIKCVPPCPVPRLLPPPPIIPTPPPLPAPGDG